MKSRNEIDQFGQGQPQATTQSEATDSSSRRPAFTPNRCIQNTFIPTQPSLRRAPSSNSWPILYSRGDGGSLFKWVRLEVSRAKHFHRGLHPAPKNDLIQIVAINCEELHKCVHIVAVWMTVGDASCFSWHLTRHVEPT